MTADAQAVYEAASRYLAGGWEVTSIPTRAKKWPWTGTTGGPEARKLKLGRADMYDLIFSEGRLNVALVMPPGVLGLDIDHYENEKGQKTGGDTIARLVAQYGELPATWISTNRRDGISGIKLYRHPNVTLETKFPEGGSVEVILPGHRYAMVAPSVHPEGRSYRWVTPDGNDSDTGPAVHELPELPDVWFDALKAGELDPDAAALGSDAAIDAAFTFTTTAQHVDNFTSALASGGEATSRHGAMLTLTSHLAGTGNAEVIPLARPLYAAAFPPHQQPERLKDFDRAAAGAVEKYAPKQPEEDGHSSVTEKMRTRLLTTDQLRALPPPEWLIENLIPDQSLTVMYGPPGVGKSFLAISAVLSIATGQRFLGYPVAKQTRSLYIIGEGTRGFGPRITAWETQHLCEARDVFWHNGAINLSHSDKVAALIDLMGENDVGHVVFDTYARCIVGLDENSAKDSGLAIEAIDRIRTETSAGVTVMHHSGKDIERGSRGNSALYAALDAEIQITDSRFKVTKQKDDEKEPPFAFTLQPVGDSVVPVYAKKGDGSKAAGALDLLRGLCGNDGHTVSSAEWKNAAGLADTTFYAHQRLLLETGEAIREGSGRSARYRPAAVKQQELPS